jgi:hypothetical protein
MPLLLKLMLAHLLGDFVLQPTRWVKEKEQRKLKAWQLYVHVIIHGILLILIVQDSSFMLPGVVIVVSHFIIDAIKITFQKKSTKRRWFVIDQSLHITVLITAWYWAASPTIDFEFLNDANVLLITTCIIFLTTPTSVIVKNTISRWNPTEGHPSADSLDNAGKFIGILERLFVFVFVVTQHWEGIGFLIAAKSIFRFGDLKQSSDLKLTEYILIGTLLSFGIAFAIGLVCMYLIRI